MLSNKNSRISTKTISERINPMKELKISEFSFHEFLQAFQDAVIDGYRLDLESNERFPQKYGSHLEVTVVQPEAYVAPKAVTETVTEPVTEVPEELVTELPTEQPVEVTTPTRTRKSK